MSIIEIIFLVFFLVGLFGLLVTGTGEDRWKHMIEVIGPLLLYFREKKKTKTNGIAKENPKDPQPPIQPGQ
tara:strand:- start:2922 stop:3134 length:213 start_codon:yes stop_codon:yes gene_type:complete